MAITYKDSMKFTKKEAFYLLLVCAMARFRLKASIEANDPPGFDELDRKMLSAVHKLEKLLKAKR